jgi:hypothetical protein
MLHLTLKTGKNREKVSFMLRNMFFMGKKSQKSNDLGKGLSEIQQINKNFMNYI